MTDFFARMGILGELMQFLWTRKLYWLIPMVIVVVVFGVLIFLGSNPGTQPFIYSIW